MIMGWIHMGSTDSHSSFSGGHHKCWINCSGGVPEASIMAHIPGWFHISGIQLASVGFSWHGGSACGTDKD